MAFDGIITFLPPLENIKETTSTFWHLKNKLDVKDKSSNTDRGHAVIELISELRISRNSKDDHTASTGKISFIYSQVSVAICMHITEFIIQLLIKRCFLVCSKATRYITLPQSILYKDANLSIKV